MARARRLQHFVLLDRLESGGMGEVFLGRDERTGRMAAIKTLSERLSREELYVRRFQREARLYRNLQHPNIVSFLSSGFESGIYFIAMEYIKGRSLARILEIYQPLEAAQAVCILSQLTEALQFAHRQYVIHRDIKPRNVMITTEGVVKLVDFGIAHTVDHLLQTDASQMVGTFYYASPEQLLGSKVTVKSDLYSLGLVLYEMLGGRRALGRTDTNDTDPITACKAIEPLRTLRPGLDEELYSIVGRLLAFDPTDRFPTTTKLLRELGHRSTDPVVLKPLVEVFGDEPTTQSKTLGTLSTTMSMFLRRSLLETSRTWRLVLLAGFILWVVLSFLFYFILGS